MLLNRDRAIEIMEREHLDALVAATPENVMYASDFEIAWAPFSFGGKAFAILPRSTECAPTLIIPEWALAYVAETGTWMTDIRTFGAFGIFGDDDATLDAIETKYIALTRQTEGTRRATPELALVSALRELGLDQSSIGTDAPQTLDYLKDSIPGAHLQSGRALFREIRAVKTLDELDRLRRACEINEAGIRGTLPQLTNGTQWRAIGESWQTRVMLEGGRPAFWFSGGGRRGAGMFGVDAYELMSGDAVRFECGCTYRGYWADTGRTGVIGESSEKLQRYHAALRAAHEIVEASIQPGMHASELPMSLIREIQSAGIPHFGHSAWGHGLGLEVYDLPRITPDSTDVLEKDMIFALETPYFEVGWGGLQIEDTYRVTATGVERLTKLPLSLLGSNGIGAVGQ